MIEVVLELARALATSAHEGQLRKNGQPYVSHLAQIAERLRADPDLQAVGWLHDVLEDTGLTAEDLLCHGIPEDVVAVVVTLTKRREERFEQYIERVSKCERATTVKIADILSNLSDNPGKKQIAKFARALLVLCRE
jgi:(p)ppGpp synthase/HD superfamily hydrolase